MTEAKVMGQVIGTCEGSEVIEDAGTPGVQFTQFKPSPEYPHLPTCDYLYINLFEGVYRLYDGNGEIKKRGKVFT